MLDEILRQFSVATTALLANFWKSKAKDREHWPQLTIRQGGREKPLYKDPYLELFINEAVAQEASERLDKRMWLPLATRTRYFRQTISEAVKTKGIGQVLILGSGFDTLSFRKKKYPVHFFEIDQAPILECKHAILERHGIDKNAIYLGLDYTTEDFVEKLKQQTFDFSIPTVVLWEGNSFYLEKEKVFEILEKLAENFLHLVISFDYFEESFSEVALPFKSFFSTEEMLEKCRSLGLLHLHHKNTAELALDYAVDETPYHTSKPYTVITFEKGCAP